MDPALPTTVRSGVAGNFSVLLDDALFNDTLTAGSIGGEAGGADASLVRALAGGQKGAGAGGASALAVPDFANPAALAEAIRKHFFLTFHRDVPFPWVPRAPLLYVPEVVRDAFTFPTRSATFSDIDAMRSHLLEAIPTEPYLTRPADARAMTEYSKMCDADYARRVEELRAQGLRPSLVVKPKEFNPELDDEDVQLVDVDFSEDPMHSRLVPSLALLQKPLYTEMSAVPSSARALAREARVLEVAGQTQGSAAGTARSASNRQASMVSEARGASVPSPMTSGGFVAGVEKTFKNSLKLEADFDAFLEAVARKKLGVVAAPGAEGADQLRRSGVMLVKLLFRHAAFLQVPQQWAVWHAACAAARSPTPALTDEQIAAIPRAFEASADAEQRRDPEFIAVMSLRLERWSQLYATTIQLVDVDARLAALTHGARDKPRSSVREPLPSVFDPAEGIARPPKLRRVDSHDTDPTPLAMLPVYPSGYQRLLRSSSSSSGGGGTSAGAGGEHYSQLASSARTLTHVTIQNQREEGSDVAPRLLMETRRGDQRGAALLNAFSVDGDAAKRPREPLEPGATTSYTLSIANQFEQLYHVPFNKQTYIFTVGDEVVEYDRIGTRTVLQRDTSRKMFRSNGEFLVVWEEAGESAAKGGGGGGEELPTKRMKAEATS